MNKAINTIGYLSAVMLLLAAHSSAATCRNDITASTPDQDFTLHNDGTVTHNSTGLMWMRCSLGQTWDGSTCTGVASTFTWQNALGAAQSHNFAGHSDWRLPNKNELASLVEQRCVPAINSTIFPSTQTGGWFWSSSPYAGHSNYAWGVGFDGGGVYDYGKDLNFQVRLVRAGQTNAGPGDGPTPVPGSIASVALPNLAQHQVVFQLEGQPKNHILMMFDEKPRMKFYSVGVTAEDDERGYFNVFTGEWQQTATKLSLSYIDDTSDLELTTADGMLRLGATYNLSVANETRNLRVKTIYPFIQKSWQISDITGYRIVLLSESKEPYVELTFYANQRLHTNHGEYLWRYSGARDIEISEDGGSTWGIVSWLRDWQNWQTGWRGTSDVMVISVYPVALDE
jgi:hypothetical protein